MPSVFDQKRGAWQYITIGETMDLNNSWQFDLMSSAPGIRDPGATHAANKK